MEVCRYICDSDTTTLFIQILLFLVHELCGYENVLLNVKDLSESTWEIFDNYRGLVIKTVLPPTFVKCRHYH